MLGGGYPSSYGGCRTPLLSRVGIGDRTSFRATVFTSRQSTETSIIGGNWKREMHVLFELGQKGIERNILSAEQVDLCDNCDHRADV